MKKLIFLLLFLPMLVSCISLVSKKDLDMWALSNGYILAENIPDITYPERQALPHPEVTTIQLKDSSGNYIPITEAFLMKTIVTLFGTIEKFQYLVEIYEREYLNAGGKIMPDMSLEDLKKVYLERVKALGTVTALPSTGSSTILPEMNVTEFAYLVELFNYFQETGEQ